VRGIAADRRLDEGEVRAIVDRGPLTTKEALDAKLIDHAGYRDEAIAAARRRSGGGRIVSLRHYIDGVGEAHRQGPAIALIHASGLIQRGRSSENPLSGGGFVGADTLARAFRDAARDKDIRAILFRIDSRGGSAVASETIWRATQEARRAGKPIVVSMGDIAGSGGYYIAAGADKIVAEPATLTGSIGVVAGKILVEGLMRKLGASWDGVEVGANAGIASSLQDFSPAGRARFEAILDEVYGGFKDRVAEGRKLGGDAVEAVAKGRVWTGEDAKAKGLVDELGGYDKALLLAKQAAGIPGDQEVTLKQFPEPGAATEALLARLLGRDREPDEGAQMTASGGGALGALRPMWQAIEAAVGPAGMLTMPPIMVR
jgi:protease-4